ncbi:MAG TPA: sulfite exporter TauE/SafE family protein [Polyangiaceae bacterium]
MNAFWAPVLVASFAGSLHCAAMCGPFAAAVSGFGTAGRASSATIAAYHLGRLATYLGLGAVAGLVGGALDLAGSAAGVGRISAFVAAAILILSGVSTLAARNGFVELRNKAPRRFGRRLGDLLVWARDLPAFPRALLMGSSTALVPCGWLYAFVATAAGSGRVASALVVMGAFWLGTVPSLLAAGIGWRGLFARLGSHARTASALLIIASGVFILAMRAGAQPDAPSCPLHGH